MSSPGRLYRVVKGFRWIEGGSRELQWKDGQAVAYEPGDTVYIEDQDLPTMYLYLKGIDDAGRAALEKVRAKVEAPPRFTAVADIDRSTCEWARAFDERHRRAREEGRVETTYVENRDGTTTPLSTKVYPAKRKTGVVYDDNGLPLPYDTARQRKLAEMERKQAAIKRGASKGGKRGRDTKRDRAACRNEALGADVRAYREKHPGHGRPAIAAALVDKLGRPIDHADPTDRKRAVAALTKRIDRLEKK